MQAGNFLTVTAATAFAFVSTLGVGDVFDNEAPQPKGAELIHLTYSDGMFHQAHRVLEGDVIDMVWTAQILRNGRVLCSGGGRGPYTSFTDLHMDPDTWTGGECPELQSGDLALAAWRWVNPDGSPGRIFTDITL